VIKQFIQYALNHSLLHSIATVRKHKMSFRTSPFPVHSHHSLDKFPNITWKPSRTARVVFFDSWMYTIPDARAKCTGCIKAKFHYAIWIKPAPNQIE